MFSLYELVTFLSVFCHIDETLIIRPSYSFDVYQGTISSFLNEKDNHFVRAWKKLPVVSFGYNCQENCKWKINIMVDNIKDN